MTLPNQRQTLRASIRVSPCMDPASQPGVDAQLIIPGYRQVFGQPHKEKYENIKVSASAWDTNLVSASASFVACNWQASGGGAYAVIPLAHTGKLPDIFPLVRCHTAPVLDTAWSPFDDSLIASAGEDGRVALARIDETVLEAAFSGDAEVADIEPLSGNKMGHGRKAGNLLWHPTAEGVLASASYEVKLWDVNTQECKVEMQSQPDMVGSMSFSYIGDTLATTCRDKKLRLYDTRSGGAPHTVAESHGGVKGSRVCWMGDLDRICTTGFSRMSDRQVFLWDTRKLTAPIKQTTIDTSAGTLMPFFSAGQNIVFIAGKGDGNVRYYEYKDDELHPLSEYKSSDPQRGMCFLPPRSVNVGECEIARAYKVYGHTIEPISFIVPRKSDSFQSDLYPPAPSGKAAQSAGEFFSGKNVNPLLMNMDDQSQAALTPLRKSTAQSTPLPASAAASPAQTPAQSRQATNTSSAETPKPASTPIHPAASVADAGGVVPSPRSTTSPAPMSRPTSPPPATETPTKTGSSSTGASDNDALKQENARLKNELSERDHLIRKLELQVEQLTANARKAREALGL